MATIIDKRCGEIGKTFLDVVRNSRVLEDQPSIPQGSHDLVMGNLRVNAVAGRNLLNQVTYSYYLGTALALFDAAMTLAATPEFYPAIALDRTSVKHYRSVTPSSFVSYEEFTASRREELKSFTPHRMPDSRERVGLGITLYQNAARFVAFHEQGHFLRGHLHYLYSTSKKLSFAELPTAGGEREAEPAVARALEFDADGFAAAVAFGDLLTFASLTEQANAQTGANLTQEDYAHLFLLGVACLFAVLHRTERSNRNDQLTHPSAAARVANIWRYFVGTHRRSAANKNLTPDNPISVKALADMQGNDCETSRRRGAYV